MYFLLYKAEIDKQLGIKISNVLKKIRGEIHMVNNTNLIGRLTKESDFRYTPTGQNVHVCSK